MIRRTASFEVERRARDARRREWAKFTTGERIKAKIDRVERSVRRFAHERAAFGEPMTPSQIRELEDAEVRRMLEKDRADFRTDLTAPMSLPHLCKVLGVNYRKAADVRERFFDTGAITPHRHSAQLYQFEPAQLASAKRAVKAGLL